MRYVTCTPGHWWPFRRALDRQLCGSTVRTRTPLVLVAHHELPAWVAGALLAVALAVVLAAAHRRLRTGCPRHGGAVWRGRCVLCGHRMYGPQTRTRPPWTWPGELVDRHRARKVGRRLLKTAERAAERFGSCT